MPALEVLAGQVTAPGATLTPITMNTGNTLTIRNAPIDTKVILVATWALNQVTGQMAVKSPRLHDNVNGITLNVASADADILTPLGIAQALITQDTLSVSLSGSGGAGAIEKCALLIYYPELPGIAGRFISPKELKSRLKNIMTVTNTLTTGITGNYSGEEAINAEQDNFKANTDYALIGYQTDANANVIRWRGADVGNIGIGGPGNLNDKTITRDWFVKISDAYDIPMIPVFNSANKSSILIDCHVDENGINPVVNSIFGELNP